MRAKALHQSQENANSGQRAAARSAAPQSLQKMPAAFGEGARDGRAGFEQSNLGEIANGGHRAAQLKTLAQLVSQSPQATRQRALAQDIAHSPRMAVQGKATGATFGGTMQRREAENPNRTGLPDQLKSGVESLSGMSMDHVKVHYNSPQPAQLNAYAYAQGSDIHIAPGQEKHLPHEAWHVVQQAQGRVAPTMQMKDGVPVNDDTGLEHEADVMGAKAVAGVTQRQADSKMRALSPISMGDAVQLYAYNPGGSQTVTVTGSAGTVKTFKEATTSSVSYLQGETYDHAGGSVTTNPAEWDGVLKDGGTTANNATQLHLVNRHWGGSGAQNGGNIFPGSRSLNGHHKAQENAFRNLFTGLGTTAPYNITYTCATNGPVANHTFIAPSPGVKAADVILPDPAVTVTVTNNTTGNAVALPPGGNVAPGDGMLLKDPG